MSAPNTAILALVLSAGALAAMAWQHPDIGAVYAALVLVAWLAFVLVVPPERRTSFR